ncbi:MAG: carbon-nitrogen hydrolase family protein [Vicinamibacterales bacterium]
MNRIRVASLQYYIRPVHRFDEFRDQVEALVETAADYKAHLMVFPEYFSTQLLTLGNTKRPMPEQIADLAAQSDAIDEVMIAMARKSGMYIVGGTVPVVGDRQDMVFNQCTVYAPTGSIGRQRKLHMTRFEAEEWGMSAGHRLRVFDTAFGRIAVNICYDVEFPELARAAARAGATILVVPTCTDDRLGYLRVRYCAQARAIENQIYVVQSCTVGSLPMVPAVSLNWGQAAMMTPSDFPFARDGIVAEGVPNQESMIVGDLDPNLLLESRTSGTVLPLRDSQASATVAANLEVVPM